jgi:hypothetical protein
MKQLLFAQDTIGELIYLVKNFVRHNLDDRQDQIEKAEYFITDDFKHGLHEKSFEGLRVISSNEYIELFDETKLRVPASE